MIKVYSLTPTLFGIQSGKYAFSSFLPPSSFLSGKETEKAKDRYDKATMKLHMLHNQYVLALKGAQLHQHQYYDATLPLFLDSLQKMQEEMIKGL